MTSRTIDVTGGVTVGETTVVLTKRINRDQSHSAAVGCEGTIWPAGDCAVP